MRPHLIRLCVAALAVAGFLTLSPRASADTINLTLDPGVPGNPNGNGLNGGGAFHWTQTTPINTNYGSAITTYCADIYDGIRSGSFTVSNNLTAISTISASEAAAITTLFDHFYGSSLTSATMEAAFQLALWELIYDGVSNPNLVPNTPGAGSITAASGAVRTAAQGMLSGSSWNGTEHDLANASLVALIPNDTSWKNPRNQDQIAVIPNPPVKGVPAPPAVMLAGIGMLALFGRSRWTRNKATPAV